MTRLFSEPIKLAVFDVDRTILRKTSGEAQLIRFLIRHRMLPYTNIIRVFVYFFKTIFKGFHKAALRNKLYMYGVDEQVLKALLHQLYEKHLESRISTYASQMILDLKRQGYMIFLLSGTLDFIVQLLVQIH